MIHRFIGLVLYFNFIKGSFKITAGILFTHLLTTLLQK